MSGYKCSVILGEVPSSDGRKQRWASAEDSLNSAGSWKFNVSRSKLVGTSPSFPHCDLLERKPQSLMQNWESALCIKALNDVTRVEKGTEVMVKKYCRDNRSEICLTQ